MSHAEHTHIQRRIVDNRIAVAHSVGAKNYTPSLQDNRAQHTAQLKSSTSQNGTQITDPSQVLQAKSKVQNIGTTFSWGHNKTVVGHQMKAWLDPSDPLKGESASVNTDQTPMMDALRRQYVINGGDLVKGHLLNDNLGGKALNNNLFPITRAANKQHLITTENYAKKELWQNGHALWYTVNVTGVPDITKQQHQFNVKLGKWDVHSNKEWPAAISGSIVSDMGDPRDFDGANPDDLESYSAGTLAAAIKAGRAYRPHSGPGTMDSNEKAARNSAGAITNSEHDNTGYTHIS